MIFIIFSYIEWSLHEPYSGVYNFEGQADFEHFLTIAKQENMNVLIRPGPFISAERDLVSIKLIVKTIFKFQYYKFRARKQCGKIKNSSTDFFFFKNLEKAGLMTYYSILLNI